MFTHLDQYRQMHASGTYGASSARVAPFLIPHIRTLKPASILDYGCGQSVLPDLIGADRYDPAIPAYSERPAKVFDLLVSVDVLEHIPMSELDGVLSDMRGLARNAMLIIDTKPARQFLPNGENAHAIVEQPEWWRERLQRHWQYLEPFHSKPADRARFKTWPTRSWQKPALRIEAETRALRYRMNKSALRRGWQS